MPAETEDSQDHATRCRTIKHKKTRSVMITINIHPDRNSWTKYGSASMVTEIMYPFRTRKRIFNIVPKITNGKGLFLKILKMVVSNTVIAKMMHSIYGTGFAVMEIIPDHIERILQKSNKLKIRKMFVNRK